MIVAVSLQPLFPLAMVVVVASVAASVTKLASNGAVQSGSGRLNLRFCF